MRSTAKPGHMATGRCRPAGGNSWLLLSSGCCFRRGTPVLQRKQNPNVEGNTQTEKNTAVPLIGGQALGLSPAQRGPSAQRKPQAESQAARSQPPRGQRGESRARPAQRGRRGEAPGPQPAGPFPGAAAIRWGRAHASRPLSSTPPGHAHSTRTHT